MGSGARRTIWAKKFSPSPLRLTRFLMNCRMATISEPRQTEPALQNPRRRLLSTTLVAREPKKYHDAKAPATVTCTVLATYCQTQ